jgi:hypothetical protein
MVHGALVFALNSGCEMAEVVSLALLKPGEIWGGLDVENGQAAADCGFVFGLHGYFGAGEVVRRLFIFALLPKSGRKGVEFLLGFVNLLLKIAEGGFEIAHLLLIFLSLIEFQSSEDVFCGLDVETVSIAVGGCQRLSVEDGDLRVTGKGVADEFGGEN